MVPPIKWSFEVEIKTEKQAYSIVDALDEQERKKLLDALNKKMWTKEEKKESKETIEKTPELDKENFRIDSTNWKEITDPNGVKVKENPEWDVWEYVEGKYKWEQLFTQDSALREANKAGKTLPASWTTYRDIINKKYEWNYQDFFYQDSLKWENMIFAGWRTPDGKEFYGIDGGFDLRCADGSDFHGGRNEWAHSRWDKDYGFSVRCLKD